MTTVTAGEHRVIDAQYERWTGIPRRVERVYWWPTREWVAYCVEIDVGRSDGCQANPDAALTPDTSLFGPPEQRSRQKHLVEYQATRRMDTDSRVYAYLDRRGPSTAVAIRSALGLSQAGVWKCFDRRPDLFVAVGETRNKRNRIVSLWDIRRGDT